MASCRRRITGGITSPDKQGPGMTRTDLGRLAILVAGTATAAMGAFHFALPHLFGWSRFTHTLPAEIQWALFALNAFLSLLLVAGGMASILVVRRTSMADLAPIWAMAAFWVYNSVYQLVWPFPAPVARWPLLGFAVGVTLCYGMGLLLQRRSR
jgi:hypothetical protein